MVNNEKLKNIALVAKDIKSKQISNIKNRLFFRENDEFCWKLEAHIDYMIENGINEMDLCLARREANVQYFYCKYYGAVGVKSDGCGRFCEGYKARNGKSGICKHYGYAYYKTDICFTIKNLKG